jgi:curli production assembly/transport component CsgG
MSWTYVLIFLMGMCLSGCSTTMGNYVEYSDKPFTQVTPTGDLLRNVPDLGQEKITIAIYDFPDRTGQRKPSERFSQLSTAVTQGPEVYLIQALKMESGGDWFTVVERKGLGNLVKERQLVRSTRELYDGEKNAGTVLKPLIFAGLIIEGGVVSYDSNTVSGGEGARVFGIGASKQYRTDQVTVALRVIAVQTGEVLMTISASKTIASYQTGADVFRFFDLRTKALEVETGAAINEPTDYAIRSAIEYAVLKMVEQGEQLDYWKFKKWRVKE